MSPSTVMVTCWNKDYVAVVVVTGPNHVMPLNVVLNEKLPVQLAP